MKSGQWPRALAVTDLVHNLPAGPFPILLARPDPRSRSNATGFGHVGNGAGGQCERADRSNASPGDQPLPFRFVTAQIRIGHAFLMIAPPWSRQYVRSKLWIMGGIAPTAARSISSCRSTHAKSQRVRPRLRRPHETKLRTFSMLSAGTLWPGVLLRHDCVHGLGFVTGRI